MCDNTSSSRMTNAGKGQVAECPVSDKSTSEKVDPVSAVVRRPVSDASSNKDQDPMLAVKNSIVVEYPVRDISTTEDRSQTIATENSGAVKGPVSDSTKTDKKTIAQVYDENELQPDKVQPYKGEHTVLVKNPVCGSTNMMERQLSPARSFLSENSQKLHPGAARGQSKVSSSVSPREGDTHDEAPVSTFANEKSTDASVSPRVGEKHNEKQVSLVMDEDHKGTSISLRVGDKYGQTLVSTFADEEHKDTSNSPRVGDKYSETPCVGEKREERLAPPHVHENHKQIPEKDTEEEIITI